MDRLSNDKKRIGIITYWWSNTNYGQILQMYALQQFLRKLGYLPFLIKYSAGRNVTPKGFSFIKKLCNPIKIAKAIRSRYLYKNQKKEEIKYPRGFEQFRKRYIEQSELYNCLDQLKKFPPAADVYITGSDIVWSAPRPAFFLDFGDVEIKRIAYAASFGSDEANQEMLDFMRPLISRFSFIGVRETEGVEICKKAGREDAKTVFDPTLLLACRDYMSLIKLPAINQSYVFLYMTEADTLFPMSAIKKVLKQNALELIYVTCGRIDRYPKKYPTIEEWMGYCANAELIITNSFHGCIFSILFKKKFVFLPLRGIHEKLNVRVFSLLKIMNLTNRICYDSKELGTLLNTVIDYSGIDRYLNEERKRSEDLFSNII